jgi:transcriptional regulator with XRE-family HTH domain
MVMLLQSAQIEETGGLVSPLQCRLARTALRLGYEEAAKLCDVAVTTLQRIEQNDPTVTERTIRRVRRAFEAAGVEFIGNTGVDLKVPK